MLHFERVTARQEAHLIRRHRNRGRESLSAPPRGASPPTAEHQKGEMKVSFSPLFPSTGGDVDGYHSKATISSSSSSLMICDDAAAAGGRESLPTPLFLGDMEKK